MTAPSAPAKATRREWIGLSVLALACLLYVMDLVRTLTPAECLEPGYYRDPDWSVRDVVAHLGTWLAESEVQFERITAGT